MKRSALITRAWFWFLARPAFRTVDWFCSYTAWLLGKGGDLAKPGVRELLAALDRERADLQRDLGLLAASHGDACAECEGACCKDERFRDAFHDRILQDPATTNLIPRSRKQAARETDLGPLPLRGMAPPGRSSAGYCPNCTPEGCRIQYHQRPIQCTAYYCWKSISLLSDEECETGISALTGLMGVMLRTVGVVGDSRAR